VTRQRDERLFALSIQQPWAGLIACGMKDIENRSWRTDFRGPVLIHAGKAIDREAMEDIAADRHPVTGERGFVTRQFVTEVARGEFLNRLQLRGGFVGQCEVVDCLQGGGSDWYVGPWGFVIRRASPLPLIPFPGQLGFFRVPPAAVGSGQSKSLIEGD
jgi:hypothetical protein